MDRFKEPISKLQSSITVTLTEFQNHLTTVRAVELRLLMEAQLRSSKPLTTDVFQDPSKPITSVIDNGTYMSQETYQIRIDAITVVSNYLSALASVNNTSDQADFEKQIGNLKDSTTALSKAIASQTGSSDKTITSIGTEISNLSGVLKWIGKFLVDQELEKAMDESISEGFEPLSKILSLLRTEDVELKKSLNQPFSALISEEKTGYGRLLWPEKIPDPGSLQAMQYQMNREQRRTILISIVSDEQLRNSIATSDDLDAKIKEIESLLKQIKGMVPVPVH